MNLKEQAEEKLIQAGFNPGTDRFDMAVMGYMMGWQDKTAAIIQDIIDKTKEITKES